MAADELDMDIRGRLARSLVLGIAVVGLSACAAGTTVESPTQTDASGAAATVLAVTGGQQAGCATERTTVETAIDTYFAVNGKDIATLDDLVPSIIKESVSARWSLATGANGSPAIVGIGVCEGA